MSMSNTVTTGLNPFEIREGLKHSAVTDTLADGLNPFEIREGLKRASIKIDGSHAVLIPLKSGKA